MNLSQKYVLPKSQMTINSLLAGIFINKEDKETENHQLNFSHEDFSIQIKHNYLLSINFYEPDLQDVEWNIEFFGVKNINHVAISQYKRKRIRFLYAKNNVLYFYEGHLTNKSNRYTLKDSLLQSEKVLPLNELQNNDEVLFISSDMTPNEKAGLFLICTVQNNFLILKGNKELYELINLNPSDTFNKIISSLSKLFTQNIERNLQISKEETVSYLSLRKPEQKEEFFKVIMLRNFEATTRLISLPLVPGEKCQREIILTNTINFETRIRENLQAAPEEILKALTSYIYRLSEVEICVFFLIEKDGINNGDDCFYVVSLVYNFEKSEIVCIHDLPIFSKEVQNIELRKVPEISELVINVQYTDRVVLNHVEMDTLRYIKTLSFEISGPTMLCESVISESLILLSPYQILDINMSEQAAFDKDSHMENEEEEVMKEERVESMSSMDELHRNLTSSRQKMTHFYREHKLNEITRIIDNLLFEIDNIIKEITSTNKEHFDAKTIISIYLTLLMYRELIGNQTYFDTQNKKALQFEFTDLIKNNYQEITEVLGTYEKEKQVFSNFLQLWINVIEVVKTKSWFENDEIRNLLSSEINGKFSDIINKALENNLGLQERNENSINENENLEQWLLYFVRSTSGIVKIERENYRFLIHKISSKQDLKNIVIDIVNIDLLTIFYFEFGLISANELQSAYHKSSEIKDSLAEEFIRAFLQEFIMRLKPQSEEKIHENSRNFNNLISIFSDHKAIVKQVIESSESNLYILTALKYGERQNIKEYIREVIKILKRKENQQVNIEKYFEKLRLIINENHQIQQQERSQMMKE